MEMGQQKMISGVGVGEGPAAVRGNQSGAEGAAVVMPTFSREIEAWNLSIFRFPAPTSLYSEQSK